MANQNFTQNTSNQNFGSLDQKTKTGNSTVTSIQGQTGGRGTSSSEDEDVKKSDTSTSTSTPSSTGSRPSIRSQSSISDASPQSSEKKS